MNPIQLKVDAPWHLLLSSFGQPQKQQKKTATPSRATPRLTGRALANARLLTAAAAGDLFELRLALEAGADVNAARDRQQKRTALMLAISAGDSDDTSSEDGSSRSMREMESEFRRDTERLGEALAGEVPAVVTALLRAGAQVNLPDASGGTALHYAVTSGNRGICRELLRRRANVNAAASGGLTPLVVAVIRHDPEMVALLLRAGANPKERRLPGRLPLLLLALRPEPRKKDEGEGLTSILGSVMGAITGDSADDAQREEVVELLLGAGLDPREAAQRGWTALYVASEAASPRLVRRLIAKGAKVDAALDNGSTPLALAAWSGRADNVRVLLEAGANPSAVDKDGDTPLMLAAEKGSYAAVELLLKAGAKAGERSKEGQTARDIASGLKHTGIVRLIDAHATAGP